jgi:hypothetical protein
MIRGMFVGMLFLLSQEFAWPQTVDMKTPNTRKLEKGKLSVVFKDTVDEDEASRVIRQLGYSVAASKFKPVILFAQADDALSRTTVQQLSSHPQFLDIHQQDLRPFVERGKQMMRMQDSARWGALKDTMTVPRVSIVVAFKSNTRESDLWNFVKQIGELKQPRISKSLNEMIINVSPGAEEAAITRLRKSRLVEIVSYVVAQ